MQTPIFGPFDVGRSTNLAANSITNLYPELVETKDGKAVGALYGCPGLDLLATVGTGPIRGTQVMAGALYVVSGAALYSAPFDTGSVARVRSTLPERPLVALGSSLYLRRSDDDVVGTIALRCIPV